MISLLIFSATWYKLIKCAWSQFHGHLFMHLWTFWIRAAIFPALTTNDSSESETEVGCFLQRFKVQLSRDQTRSRIGTAVSTWRWLWLASIYKAYEDCVQECLTLRSWLLSPEVHQCFAGSTTSGQQCPQCFIFLDWAGSFFPKHIHPLCSIKGFYTCVTLQTSFLWKHDWES